MVVAVVKSRLTLQTMEESYATLIEPELMLLELYNVCAISRSIWWYRLLFVPLLCSLLPLLLLSFVSCFPTLLCLSFFFLSFASLL